MLTFFKTQTYNFFACFPFTFLTFIVGSSPSFLSLMLMFRSIYSSKQVSTFPFKQAKNGFGRCKNIMIKFHICLYSKTFSFQLIVFPKIQAWRVFLVIFNKILILPTSIQYINSVVNFQIPIKITAQLGVASCRYALWRLEKRNKEDISLLFIQYYRQYRII